MHLVLVNRLGGLSLPMNSMSRLSDWLDMTLIVLIGSSNLKSDQQTNIVGLFAVFYLNSPIIPYIYNPEPCSIYFSDVWQNLGQSFFSHCMT